jgi:polyisoprenoid-binding protein YceI
MTTTAAPNAITTGTWALDPERSSVEFQVKHFYGLMTVKGHFDRYHGALDASSRPAAALTIDADSLDTGHKKRDKHLRSDDFFGVDKHPTVRFEADTVALDGESLTTTGTLWAGGQQVTLDLAATVTAVGDEYELEAVASVDHRELGMTWSPLGIMRAPSKLVVRGRLVREG